VGKTTVARLLTEGSPAGVHLETDQFFHFISSGYIEPWRPESHGQNATVMRAVGDCASVYADAGYRTIVEGIVSPRWFYEPLRDALQRSGQAVAYVVLRAPLAVCTSQAASRDARSLANASVVEQLWHEFNDLGVLERHVLDVKDRSAIAIAEEIELRLAAGDLSV
jgi:predicted kinase